MNPLLEIIISPTGETRLTTKGFTGSNCRTVSQFLEEALGRRLSEQLTSEFYQSHATDPLHQQQHG